MKPKETHEVYTLVVQMPGFPAETLKCESYAAFHGNEAYYRNAGYIVTRVKRSTLK